MDSYQEFHAYVRTQPGVIHAARATQGHLGIYLREIQLTNETTFRLYFGVNLFFSFMWREHEYISHVCVKKMLHPPYFHILPYRHFNWHRHWWFLPVLAGNVIFHFFTSLDGWSSLTRGPQVYCVISAGTRPVIYNRTQRAACTEPIS